MLKIDRKAQAMLQSTLALNLTQIVEGARTAKAAIDTTEAYFANESLSIKVDL